MRLLVLGGTWFVGHAIVKTTIDVGWEVTTFNRGISDPFLEAVRPVRGDRTRPEDVAALAAAGPWDAVVDTSASTLKPRVDLSIISERVDRPLTWAGSRVAP
ncbi:NAD-dependent epimerase/dehydratase family protein [Micromonospora zamorensis]|uniref:NAD-dependent epimerase/dehydratase family protein n=1 Tax=Micromonospora zamorensis TaxID=709883 RepID=UPI0033DA3BC2